MMSKIILKIFLLVIVFVPVIGLAQAESEPEAIELVHRAKVLEIINESEEQFGNDTLMSQNLQIEIIAGDRKGEVVEFEHEFFNEDFRFDDRTKFFLLESHDAFNDDIYYSIAGRDRTPTIIGLFVLFALVVIGFAGKQGIRSIIGLFGSFSVVVLVLIPGLLKGFPPIPLTLGVGVVILIFAIVVTHGWNRTSLIALAGTSLTLVATIVLSLAAVELADLTGFISDEVASLNFNTFGEVNIRGLLLGGILVGVLGVLDDIAITQVAVVRQLWAANTNLSKKEVFARALSVGRDHMSSLVNTLVLAYLGVGLPLIMLLRTVDATFLEIINQEAVTAEIVRMLVGSIGLIVCVPITTWLAIKLFRKGKDEHSDVGHVCPHGHVH